MLEATSQILTGAPPSSATRRSWPSAKNPKARPSGDQNIEMAPAVPATGVGASSASARIQICGRSPAPVARNARRDPSGENSSVVASMADSVPPKVLPDGGGIANRTGPVSTAEVAGEVNVGMSTHVASAPTTTAEATRPMVLHRTVAADRAGADSPAGRCRRRRAHPVARGRRQVVQRIADVTKAASAVLLEAAHHERPKRGRRICRQGVPVRIATDHRGHRVRDRLAGERWLSGQHFVEDASEGPHVGSPIDGLPGCLFRTHVGRRPGDLSERGRRHRGRVRSRAVVVIHPDLREAEVEDLRRPIRRDHDVAGLEIAVHEALFVSRIEGRRNLPGQVRRLVTGNAAATQDVAQRSSVDQFHGDRGAGA